MTANTDLDGKLRAWLDLMPDEAPDRVVSAVLQVVEATPQPRPAFRRPTWRLSPMNRAFVAAAAAIAFVIAGATLLLRPPNQPAAGSSEMPSIASPAVAPSAVGLAPVPDSIAGVWMGSHRAVVADGAGIALRFSGDAVTIAQSNSMSRPVVVGQAALGLDQRLQIRANVGQCTDASFGLYHWELSPSGRVLTVSAANDPCGDRQDALAGTYWRMGCHDTGTGCLGDLDAATYASQYITPLAAPGDAWQPKFGGVRYTVPSGWANFSDWPGILGLTTSADFATTTADQVDPADHIVVLAQAVAESQASPCSGVADGSVAATSQAILAALRGDRGLELDRPGSITIDGHRGVQVDLSVNPDTVRPCRSDEHMVEYLVAGGAGQGIGAGERQRLILLDVAPGNVLAIQIHVHDAGDFDAFVSAAMPIVESMSFR
jgi:hypothetical protein